MNTLVALVLGLFVFDALTAANDSPLVVPLWKNGAPGSEDYRDHPERAQDWWIKDIHNPTLNVFFPPEGTANGTAIVVFPGGGHQELVFNPEGRDAAPSLHKIGVTVIVVKYRLFQEEGSPYSRDDTRADALRAMRLVRAHAKDWHLRKDRIGMMGFSAGGEHVTMVTFGPQEVGVRADDPVDRESARPDFAIWIYPGGYGIPDRIPADAPPAFFVVATDDPWCFDSTLKLYSDYHRAKRPAEAHFYASGAHGFNMGQRSELRSLSTWPNRLNDWLIDYGFVATDH